MLQHIEELDELKDDDAYCEFTSRHNDVGGAVDVPEYDVPDSDVSPPDDPLYDSQRGYLTTVERAQRTSNRLTAILSLPVS